ncbi:transcriptional regulator [Rhizorhabdus wittichii DC-6]|nr:transcriptional regulator [Rhizorhabdus wittichii DC-6]
MAQDDQAAIAAHALQLALQAAGNNQSELARVCGCSQGAVWQMLNKPQPRLSHLYVLKVEQAYGIPRHLLRPDIYPRPAEAAPIDQPQAA